MDSIDCEPVAGNGYVPARLVRLGPPLGGECLRDSMAKRLGATGSSPGPALRGCHATPRLRPPPR